MKKNFSLLTGLFFFILFLVFTYLVRLEILKQFDFNTTVRLQNKMPARIDTLFSFFSLAGSFEIMFIILLAAVITRKKLFSFLAFLPFFIAQFIEVVTKAFFRHPGPPFMFLRYNINFIFPSSYVKPGFSYPSGHSLRTIFVSLIFLYLIKESNLKKMYKILLVFLLLIFDALMLISRVSLGEHWTTDVIGGAILGVSTAFFSYLFF